jgi:hypothetical protein
MFEGLDETIKHDDAAESSPRERIIKWAMVAVISVALFSGLYFAVKMLE